MKKLLISAIAIMLALSSSAFAAKNLTAEEQKAAVHDEEHKKEHDRKHEEHKKEEEKSHS